MARPIDADKLMEGLNRKKAGPHDRKYTEGFNDALARFRSMVHSAPTVSPDEVRGVGKWEDVSVHDNIQNIMIASMRCNVCKRYHNEVYHYGNPTEMARYCPVCGAKMEVRDA